MYLKIMSEENAFDHDERKGYEMLCGFERVNFTRNSIGKCFAIINRKDEVETREVSANCYLLNEQGKTIGSFCPSSLPGKTR